MRLKWSEVEHEERHRELGAPAARELRLGELLESAAVVHAR